MSGPLPWLFIGLMIWGKASAHPWSTLRDTLISRMHRQGISAIGFPPVVVDADLPANARYERDTIWVGHLQAAYRSRADSLSILYHEWQHVLQEREGRYRLCLDSLGQVPQWQIGRAHV